MLKYCVEKWDKNKTLLMNALQSEEIYNKLGDYTYADLVKLVVKYIFNDGKAEEYDAGEWDDEYLITFVDYGSCSGCDTLLGIQMCIPDRIYCESDDEFTSLKRRTIEDFMTLCLHLVQHMKKPYIAAWDKHDYSDE